MNPINLVKNFKIAILVLFITVCTTPQLVNAQSNENGNAYGNSNGNGYANGQSNSVPVNNGIYLLALAGLAFVAKKMYDLKKKQVIA